MNININEGRLNIKMATLPKVNDVYSKWVIILKIHRITIFYWTFILN